MLQLVDKVSFLILNLIHENSNRINNRMKQLKKKIYLFENL